MTRKIVTHLATHIGLPISEAIDLTLPAQRVSWASTLSSELVIVGVPVWAATIPSVLLKPLQTLHGTGKWAVPLVVYGNVGPWPVSMN